jgi:rare lipoprotein A (peptidoglycan hydrolase)
MKKNNASLKLFCLILFCTFAIHCGGGKSVRTSDKTQGKYIYTKQTFRGESSWYGKPFHGRQTASGERYDMYGMTAAHKTLPFGTLVQVTNLENNKKVIVRVNDRGPFIRRRVLDLSYAAAKKLGNH